MNQQNVSIEDIVRQMLRLVSQGAGSEIRIAQRTLLLANGSGIILTVGILTARFSEAPIPALTLWPVLSFYLGVFLIGFDQVLFGLTALGIKKISRNQEIMDATVEYFSRKTHDKLGGKVPETEETKLKEFMAAEIDDIQSTPSFWALIIGALSFVSGSIGLLTIVYG